MVKVVSNILFVRNDCDPWGLDIRSCSIDYQDPIHTAFA